MKKLIVVLVLVAAVAGAAWYFLRGEGGHPASIGAALDAEQTVGFASLEGLDQLVATLLKNLDSLPAELRDKVPPQVTDPAKRKEALGFEPTSAAGWAELGVDPAAGVSVVFDARIRTREAPLPILLVKLTDEAKLFAAIEKWTGKALKPGAEADGVRELDAMGQVVWMAKRGDYTAFLNAPRREPDAAKAGFMAFAKGAGAPLSGAEVFNAAFRGAAPLPRMAGYFSSAGLGNLLKTFPPLKDKGADIDFFVQRFPAMGGSFGEQKTQLQLVASEEGLQALRQLLQPKRSARLSSYVPAKGWGALKYTLNLAELFDGVAALIPPSASDAKLGLAMAQGLIGAQLGVGWDEISKGLAGHFLVAVDVRSAALAVKKGPLAVQWLAALSVADEATADKVLGVLTDLMVKQAKAEKSPVEVGGAQGFELKMGPMAVVVVRADDVLLVAPGKAGIEAAIKTAKGDNLRGTDAGRKLDDDDAFYGFALDVAAVFALLESEDLGMSDEERALFTQALNQPMVQALKDGPPMVNTVRLDRGVRLEGESGGMGVAIIGVAAAVAIPAFIKYQRKSMTAEARMNARRLFDSGVAYFHEEHVGADGAPLPPSFPASAPLTPGSPTEVFCKDGRSAPALPDPKVWAHPTWQALGFAPADPIRFAYQFESEGTGPDARFTARAIGDLDCDGVLSTFERIGTVDAEGNVNGGAGMFIANETE